MKRLILLISIIALAIQVQASKHMISGVVSDESGSPLPGVQVHEKNTQNGVITNMEGKYTITLPSTPGTLVFSFIGFETQEIKITTQTTINVIMKADNIAIEECVVVGYGQHAKRNFRIRGRSSNFKAAMAVMDSESHYERPRFNTEGYATIHENGYKTVLQQPLSTFSVDVDRAAYANVRRFLNNGQMPPKDAVRIEEMINYFNYDYEGPQGNTPFAIDSELAHCPWNEQHLLLKIGLQGKHIEKENLPPSNLVFLLDVSGSMNAPNKLPLLKSAMRLLVDQLRPEDRLSIVVYAGAAGLVLAPTPGNEKNEILKALDQLQSGGSTAGGAGLHLAYQTALEHFEANGNNRIILATDGDFNVGESSNASMERLVESYRDKGVFLTVLGFGMGNYKDDKMEILADKGNGNYAYIDNLQEAQKTLVSEFGGTLFTIAKDVKMQIEFNPNKIQAYRLIGYENRLLNDEDFNDDKKDAGEIGAGHTVTALYELIPVGARDTEKWLKSVDALKYQKQEQSQSYSDEWLTLKLRYKEPLGHKSKLLKVVMDQTPTSIQNSSLNLQFAASVAGFGMLLRDSQYKADLSYQQVAEWARQSRGEDESGFKAEMIRLIQTAETINRTTAMQK
jgi:Ca-activated chloride channel family protein